MHDDMSLLHNDAKVTMHDDTPLLHSNAEVTMHDTPLRHNDAKVTKHDNTSLLHSDAKPPKVTCIHLVAESGDWTPRDSLPHTIRLQ